MRLALLALIAAAVALSCNPSTRVVASWKDPTVGDLVLERPLVVFQHPSEALRRSVEDAIAERIPGAVPAYEVIATDEIFDVEGVQEKVRRAGFDTVMIMRLVDIKAQIDLLPGEPRPSYDPLWGAWTGGWTQVDNPEYLDTINVVTLESLVYALEPGLDGELVWAGRSETFDPSSFESLARSVARSSVKKMAKDGVIVAAIDPE